MIQIYLLFLSVLTLLVASQANSPNGYLPLSSSSTTSSSSTSTCSTTTKSSTTSSTTTTTTTSSLIVPCTSTTTTTTPISTLTSTTCTTLIPTYPSDVCKFRTNSYLQGTGCCLDHRLVLNWDQCHQGLLCKPRYKCDEFGQYTQNDNGKYWKDNSGKFIQKEDCKGDLYKIDTDQKYVPCEDGQFWKDQEGNFWNVEIQVQYLVTVVDTRETAVDADNDTTHKKMSNQYTLPEPGTTAQQYSDSGKANLANFASSVGVSIVLMVVLGSMMMF